MITLTPRAVVKALTLAKKEGKPPILRVGVKGGGCSGMSYVLDFVHEIKLTFRLSVTLVLTQK